MNKGDFWNGAVGTCYICILLGILAFIAYFLFSPTAGFVAPDFFGLYNTASTTQIIPRPDPLSGDDGLLFFCDGQSALKAEFTNYNVGLALSDGRHIVLPRAASAAGERYANPDESFVFWREGNSAYVLESGSMMYQNCSAG